MITKPKHIIVTTPKSEMENSALEASECIKNNGGFYLRKLGKNRPKGLDIGSKIYYIEDGYLRGFGVVASVVQKDHKYETTGRQWGDGWYAIISANTWQWIKPIKMQGFQGFRYFDDSGVEIIGNWLDSKPEIQK